MLNRLILCCALCCAVALGHAIPEARADEPSKQDMDRGVKIFTKAQKLFDDSKHEEALELFREVDALLGSPNAKLYVARCLRELDRLPEAFEAMDDAAKLASDKAEQDDRYLKTRDAAAAEREALAAKVGRVVVALDSQPEDLKVELGERALDAAELGRQLGVAPGTVTLRASAPGFQPYERTLDVGAGKLETVAVVLKRGEDDGQGTPPPDEPAPKQEGSGTLFTLGWVAAGVGVAGMVMFAVAGSMANSRFSDIQATCGAPPCTDPALRDDINGGKTLDLIANVGVGIGAVGLVAGTVMLIVGWPSGEPSQQSSELQGVMVDVGPHGASLGYTLRF